MVEVGNLWLLESKTMVFLRSLGFKWFLKSGGKVKFVIFKICKEVLCVIVRFCKISEIKTQFLKISR